MMKKFFRIVSLVLAVTLMVGLVGCRRSEDSTGSTAESTVQTTAPTETTSPVETTEPVSELAETQPVETKPAETEPAETQPSVTYTSVNETVYATDTVNVRSGPDTSYSKLGQLSKGDSITRTAIGSNGWSKVIYNGEEAYMYSSYLSTTKPSNSTNPGSTVNTSNNNGSINGIEVAKLAVEYLELKYVYGGNSLTSGVDCSGFTKLIYAQFGIALPRTAAEQSKLGTKVSLADAKPGDLYAEEYSNKTNYTGHAGIYIGNGYIISAWPNSGVYITSVTEDTTFIRLFTNTCTVSGESAIQELEKHLISKGKYGTLTNVTYYPADGSFAIRGSSPLKCGMLDGINIYFTLDAIPKGYEALWKAWQKQYQNSNGYFDVYDYNTFTTYGYINGQWYTIDEMSVMNLSSDEWREGKKFYGDFWNNSSVITNGLGEVVNLSTFPY